MEAIIPYFIKINISIAVLCLLYKFVFKKDTFFKARRWYLIVAVLFSFLYPFLAIDGLGSIFNLAKEPVEVNSLVAIGEVSGVAIMDDAVPTPLIDWMLILKGSLVVVTLFFLSRLLWQLFIIIKMRMGTVQHVVHDISYQRMSEKSTPFSFFKWIFVYPEAHSDEKLKQILIHEKVHVKQWHSIDVTLMEALTVLFWYNPFFWIMKKEIAINLEYIADSGVLDEGIDRRDYQYHLLHLTYPRGNIQLVNNFNVSQLKQRIIMMNGKRTPMKKLAKYILALPIAMFLIAANSVYAQSREPLKEDAENSIQVIGIKNNDEQNSVQVIGVKSGDMKSLSKGSLFNLDKKQKPLYIIDGLKMDKDFDLSQIKPEDLESITVLKDSAVKELYGDEAKDGVIQITTKKTGIAPNADSEDAKPMTVTIEGYDTSIKDPLVVIDGEVKGKGGSYVKDMDPSDIERISVIKDASTTLFYGDKGKDGVILITSKTPQTPQKKEKVNDNDKDELFVIIEESPEFPGGTEAMKKFLNESIVYPKEAHENGAQGRVVLTYVIEVDGSIAEIEVVSGVDPLIDAEAIRVVESMPKWKPGTHKGKDVRVRYTLPLDFKLQK